MWKFYILYEITILPISVIILGWGLNPYRFPATFYILIYTLCLSSPIIILILWNYKTYFINLIIIKNIYIRFYLIRFLIIIFLVKVPIFFFHYWLLKAHVEASTRGSIILARGLLKIGSFGIFKLVIWNTINNFYYNLILSGAVLSTMICLFQTDFKKIIALISVSHIRLSVRSLIVYINTSYKSFLFLNLSHSLSAALIFYIRGIFYSFRKTRLLSNLSFKLYSLIYYILIFIIIINIGVPPFFSFIGEIFNLSTLYYFNLINILIITIYILFTSLYRLTILNSLKYTKYKIIKNKIIYICNTYLIYLFLIWFYVFYKIL